MGNRSRELANLVRLGVQLERNRSIDCLRGLLVLMVIGGHVLEIEGRQTLLGWIGLGIRMPLVIGLSGYVLNLDRVRATALGPLGAKYGRRLALPWLIASLIYLIAGQWPIGPTTMLDLVLRAPFHLWYVPALCSFILLVRLLPLSPVQLLLVALPFGVATSYALGIHHRPIGEGLLAFDSRFTRYFLYFCFGMVVARTTVPDRYRWLGLFVALFGLAAWIFLYASDRHDVTAIAQLAMALGFLTAMPLLLRQQWNFTPAGLVGRDSMFFYLWHPLAIGLVMALGLHGTAAFVGALVGLAIANVLLGRLGIAALAGVTPRIKLPPSKVQFAPSAG